MNNPINEFDQPLGPPLPNWTPPLPPSAPLLTGNHCRLERLAPHHAPDLHHAFLQGENPAADWTYLSYGPFTSEQDFARWVQEFTTTNDPLMYAILTPHGKAHRAVGVASYLRIAPPAGSIEVGHIHFARPLQKTAAATEAMYLMARHAFELGYRRYEWKCDALNAPSQNAAQRFGFSFEGIFRNAAIYKGRLRDTAWFSITDQDWPPIKAAYERWLSPENLQHDRPQHRLSDLTKPLLQNLCNP